MEPRRHVLAAIDTLEVGGAQYHLLALARGLAHHGYRLTVVTTAGPLAPELEAAGISVVTTEDRPVSRQAGAQFTKTLLRLARTGDVDLLHAHLFGASMAAARVSALSGLPLVMTQHSTGAWQTPHHEAIMWRARRRAAALIAVSRQIGDRIERDGGTAHYIPNGADASALRPDRAATQRARARHGIPVDAFVVGFAGRLVEDKDPLLFLETASLIARSCPHAHFVMAGDGPLQPVVAAQARQLGLERRLNFTGFIPHVEVPVRLFDVLLLTSRFEGSPLIVLEALAAGVPVVATSVGDVALQIDHGATGFLTRSRDAAELARHTLTLTRPELRDRMGRTGREHAACHGTIERMVARTTALYHEVLAGSVGNPYPVRHPEQWMAPVHART